MSSLVAAERPVPEWLVTESYEELRLGTLKSGKEAEVFLVERVGSSGSCLLAHKRYRPRTPEYKGQLGSSASPRAPSTDPTRSTAPAGT